MEKGIGNLKGLQVQNGSDKSELSFEIIHNKSLHLLSNTEKPDREIIHIQFNLLHCGVHSHIREFVSMEHCNAGHCGLFSTL